MTMSSQPGTWSSSGDRPSNTRNMMSSNVYSKSHGNPKGKSKKEYNFTSADLKSQYLTQAQKNKSHEGQSKRNSK